MTEGDELLTALTAAMETARPEQGALQVVYQLPDSVPIELQPFAIEVTNLAVDGVREQLAAEPGIATNLAGLMSSLAFRLGEAGRQDEALPVSEEQSPPTGSW